MTSNSETQIVKLRQKIDELIERMQNNPQEFRENVEIARSLIADIDKSGMMAQLDQARDKTPVLSVLQRLAYHDPDDGGIRDIAEWCAIQWLKALENDPNDVKTLQGLGQEWLLQAQKYLARIHREDGSNSSNGSAPSNCRIGTGNLSYTSSDDDRDAAQAVREADFKLQGPDYAEARGILVPAVDFLGRATKAAEDQGILTGDLLALAAEASMSLGNVSFSSVNEYHFQQAVLYLRRASQMPDYEMPDHLKYYFHEYERLVD